MGPLCSLRPLALNSTIEECRRRLSYPEAEYRHVVRVDIPMLMVAGIVSFVCVVRARRPCTDVMRAAVRGVAG